MFGVAGLPTGGFDFAVVGGSVLGPNALWAKNGETGKVTGSKTQRHTHEGATTLSAAEGLAISSWVCRSLRALRENPNIF